MTNQREMRRIFTLLLSAVMLLALASCGGKTDTPQGTQPAGHVHNWEDATCVTPRFCTGCGEIDGEPLGHDMLPVTDGTSVCSRCGYTVGELLVSGSHILEIGEFHVTITDNGVFTINGEGPMEDCYDDINVVPWRGRTWIKEVVIGDGITTIGGNAFYDFSGLMNITIPDSVTKIGAYAFQKCSNLTSITLPDSVTEIDRGAFAECVGLLSITIPDCVEKMGAGVFDSCTSLGDIFVESENPYYTSIDGVLFDKSMTLLHTYPAGKMLTEYVIPDGVTKIGDSAFMSCSHLTSLTIPSGVTTIGSNAFDGCVNLRSLTIPISVEKLYSRLFSNCAKLTDVYYEGTAEEWAALTTNITVPEKVTVHYEHTA